ncbi:MAG TPA: hypothetical protein VE988_18075 [Gemmataceae bacterium]|nr:hypothetical protein [Gemmataceae bacterium]
MSKIVVDDPLIGELENAGSGATLYARDGRELGCFVSMEAYKSLVYAWAREEFRKEEEQERSNGIVRDFRQEGGITTAELLAHLRQRDPQTKQTA